MADILLCSETFVKDISNISDNVTSKYLRPAIVEAQDVKYRAIVGDALLAKLKEVAQRAMNPKEKPRPEDAPYLDLINRSRYVIAYYAIADVLPRVSYKIANAGMVTTSSEGVQQAQLGEVGYMRDFYLSKGDAHTYQLQNYLLQNRTKYPELDECACNAIRSNLYSAASCGIFLGGAGKWGRKKGGCR